jgi:hypothetical protein
MGDGATGESFVSLILELDVGSFENANHLTNSMNLGYVLESAFFSSCPRIT